MSMSLTYKELHQLDDDELIRRHDAESVHTVIGTSYYLEELARRDAQRINGSMLKCTKWITGMTMVMLVAAVFNIAIAFIG